MAEDPSVLWRLVTVAEWYGRGESAPSKSSRRRRSGTTRDCRRYPCDECWSATRKAPSPPKPCCPCTDLTAEPERVVSWFVLRWKLEVTFQEVRWRLGVETSGNGRSWRSGGRRPRFFWACSRSSRSSRINEWRKRRVLVSAKKQPGATSPPPDLRGCVGAGAQGVVGAGGDFLRVAPGGGDGKSPAGVREASNRDALLRSLMAKVELRLAYNLLAWFKRW